MIVRLTIAVGVLAIAFATAQAATIHVDVGGGGDFLTIQEGVDAAASGDTVLVAPGTYTGALNRDINFDGRLLKLIADGGRDATVIDCQSAGRAFVFSSGGTPDVRVEGFTVRNGAVGAGNGGAVSMAGGSATFFECAFENNSATWGGVFYLGHEAWPYIEYCTFEGNTAVDYGGCIYTYASQPYVYECDFTNNTAGISGGAISCKTWTVASIYNSRFIGNSAQDGGAIYIGTLFSLDDDVAPSYIGFSWFEDNTADRGGAIFLNSFSWVTSMWNTLVRNTAQQGGAVFCQTDAQGSLKLQNCTLAYNHGEYGGGICSAGNSAYNHLTVEQCVIAFSTSGNSLHRLDYSPVNADLSLAFGNEGGDVLYGGVRNLFVDPLFCDVYSDDFNLCENSPCRSVNNEWGFLMGSFRQVCGECTTPVQETSWGSIKAMYR
ncbi:MAG: hypothetical protein ABIG03_00920 [Candidatus Eisenbacteria bacterium]